MPSHLHPLSPSACDAIGRTPLVALDRITADYSGRIFAKLEMLNPGFSKTFSTVSGGLRAWAVIQIAPHVRSLKMPRPMEASGRDRRSSS